MNLTLSSDYAFRTLIYAATVQDRLITISEVAERFNISKNHLVKVVYQLIKLNYLVSTRGRYGGFKLAIPAAEINLGKVVRAIEPDFNIVECFKAEQHCAITQHCQLKNILANAKDAFLKELDKHNLQGLVEGHEQGLKSIFIQKELI